MLGPHGLDQKVEVALENGVEAMDGEADSVIGHPVFWIVVGPNALGTTSGSDLGPALRCDFVVLFCLLGV